MPDRRLVLRALTVSAAGLVAGSCGGHPAAQPAGIDPRGGSPAAPPRSPADADIALVRKAIADEEILAEFCTAVLRRHPPAGTKLTLTVTYQRQHIRRLRATLTDLDPPVARAPTRVPAGVDAALMAAGRLSARTGDARLVASQVVTAGLLAELLASVAASHAQAASILAPQGEGVALTTPTTSAPTAAQPLQSCLAAEHAAVYGYGLLGMCYQRRCPPLPSPRRRPRRTTCTVLDVTG